MMPDDSFKANQAEMREAYASGIPGAFVSGIVWLASAIVLVMFGMNAGVGTLLVGGLGIFPLSLLGCRALGASGKHTPGNPLGYLAMETTLWLMAGIFIAFATVLVGSSALFFPVMLLVIGSRYLAFQSLYGLRLYWLAGGALCIAGFLAAILNLTAWVPALLGGIIEIALAIALHFRLPRGPG
ncbi:MAG: hypothetical protein AAF958_14350 [Planctomycetota bacterium]